MMSYFSFNFSEIYYESFSKFYIMFTNCFFYLNQLILYYLYQLKNLINFIILHSQLLEFLFLLSMYFLIHLILMIIHPIQIFPMNDSKPMHNTKVFQNYIILEETPFHLIHLKLNNSQEILYVILFLTVLLNV